MLVIPTKMGNTYELVDFMVEKKKKDLGALSMVWLP
jgi:hypothetical protein